MKKSSVVMWICAVIAIFLLSGCAQNPSTTPKDLKFEIDDGSPIGGVNKVDLRADDLYASITKEEYSSEVGCPTYLTTFEGIITEEDYLLIQNTYQAYKNEKDQNRQTEIIFELNKAIKKAIADSVDAKKGDVQYKTVSEDYNPTTAE